MNILVDAPATFILIPLRRLGFYAAAAPWRAIVEFRNGLHPSYLLNAVVEGETGVETGQVGLVRAGQEGKTHLKVTLNQRVDAPPDDKLSRLLTHSYRDDDAGR